MREGFNWKDLWALGEAIGEWREVVRGKLVVARLYLAAAAYANHGAGGSPPFTLLARRFRDLELSNRCALVALNIVGRGNSVSDALSRFTSKVSGGDLFPGAAERVPCSGWGPLRTYGFGYGGARRWEQHLAPNFPLKARFPPGY